MPQLPRTSPQLLKNAWIQNMIESLANSFRSEETRQWLQVFIVDPVVAYIMERCLPYFIIAAVGILSLFLFVIWTFYLVFRGRRCLHCG